VHLGNFEREVEYLDPEMSLDAPPVEPSNIEVSTEPVIPQVDTPLPVAVQNRIEDLTDRLQAALSRE
jgi:hypothetical protein